MYQSEQVDQLTAALAVAQGQMKPARLNRVNPHFKSRYADLASILEAIRGPLSANALSYTQTSYLSQDANGARNFVLRTTLHHSSGQWIATEFPLPGVAKPQEYGSALTYARRYSLSALVGIAADDDDDANVAEGEAAVKQPPKINPPSKAAEALVEIASKQETTAQDYEDGGYPTGEKMTGQAWRRFGEQMVKLARNGQGFTPEQQTQMSAMKQERPKMWQTMADAVAAAQMKKPKPAINVVTGEPSREINFGEKEPEAPPQPNPGDDPDAYRVWLIDQLSRADKPSDLKDLFDIQRPLWEPCFPPDIEDWEALFKERTLELATK